MTSSKIHNTPTHLTKLHKLYYDIFEVPTHLHIIIILLSTYSLWELAHSVPSMYMYILIHQTNAANAL